MTRRRQLRGKDTWHLIEMAAQRGACGASAADSLMQIMDGTRGLDLKDQTELTIWTSYLHQWQGLDCRTVDKDGGLDG